ncbi:MAG: hypothetical protein CAPSK01_003736 [Candidatus Accumulibacter vicinus]|uniref:Uncharacterized protein n=1 Tax=Candidatus Accumulibacter vicinus TaxID=2954382 RepID=A0A084XWF4_9PROT|nr:MAG: hypothetical protein CAPSK01_003736 [Candidatus Accumulibacter vicinus]
MDLAYLRLLARIERGVQQQLGHSDHPVHRGANFMAHGGQELRLGTVRRFGLLLLPSHLQGPALFRQELGIRLAQGAQRQEAQRQEHGRGQQETQAPRGQGLHDQRAHRADDFDVPDCAASVVDRLPAHLEGPGDRIGTFRHQRSVQVEDPPDLGCAVFGSAAQRNRDPFVLELPDLRIGVHMLGDYPGVDLGLCFEGRAKGCPAEGEVGDWKDQGDCGTDEQRDDGQDPFHPSAIRCLVRHVADPQRVTTCPLASRSARPSADRTKATNSRAVSDPPWRVTIKKGL